MKQKPKSVKLKKSDSEYGNLFYNVPAMIHSIDANERIVDVSDFWLQKMGYKRSEVIGKFSTNFLTKESRLYAKNVALPKFYKTGFIIDVPFRFVKKNGEVLYTLLSAIVEYKDDGSFNRTLAFVNDITQQKKTEEALLSSKMMIEKIINTVPVRIFWKDKNLTYLGCNQEFAKDAGFSSSDEVIGKDDYQMGWREQAELYRADDKKVIDSGKPKLLIEEEQTTPQGEKLILLTNKIPLRNSDGEIYGVLGSYLDITERKKAQKSVLESERKYRALLENVELLAVSLDCDGTITFINDFLLKLTNWKRKEVIGKNWFDLFVPEESNAKDVFLKKILTRTIPPHFENDIKTKTGKLRIIKWNNIVLKDSDGNVTGTSSIGEDITERKRIEEKLRNSEELLRLANKATNDIIWDWDIINDTQTWNESGAIIFGWKEIVERPQNYAWWIERVHAEDRERIERSFLEVIDNQRKNFWKDEYHFLKKDGSYAQVIDRGYIVRDPDGKAVRMIGAMLDITNQKHAEKKLKESERELRIAAERYRKAQEIGHVGNWEYSIKEDTFWGSDEAKRIYGFDPNSDKFTTEEVEKLIPERDRVHQALADLIEFNKEYDIEFQINPLNSNESKTMHSIAEVILDEENKPVKVVGVVQDITVRKRFEEVLRAEKLFSESLISNLPGVFYLISEDRKFLRWNTQFEEVTGRSAEELATISPMDLFEGEDKQTIATAIKKVFSHGQVQVMARFVTKNGKKIPYQFTGHKIIVDGASCLLGVGLDYTGKEKAEEKMRRSSLILEEMSNMAKIGGWEIDLAKMKAYFTAETLNIYGLKQTEIPSIEEGINYYAPESRPVIMKAVKNAIENQAPYNIEAKFVDAKGKTKWVQTKGNVDYVDGKVVRLYGTLQDITEKKKTQEDLTRTLTELSKLKEKIEAENIYLQEEIKVTNNYEEIIGDSKLLKIMFKKIEQVSLSDTTVLILGETGTGKELVARALHGLSARNKRTLVKVNCAALPSNLIESELFGHEKGAFTGALNQKMGRFELADEGTIFLDEIAELPLELQSKLLRVLQEGEFERIGGSKTIKVDVRIITATNRNLEKAVLDGKFRQDLYYRINVYPITCPPLRERIEDIPLLVNHFVKIFNRKLNKNISVIPKKLLAELKKYYWPGNIRELENTIEKAMIQSSGDTLTLDVYPVQYRSKAKHSKFTTLKDVEKNHILNILKQTNWRIRGANGAAQILGMKPTTLESRIKKLGISREYGSEI